MPASLPRIHPRGPARGLNRDDGQLDAKRTVGRSCDPFIKNRRQVGIGNLGFSHLQQSHRDRRAPPAFCREGGIAWGRPCSRPGTGYLFGRSAQSPLSWAGRRATAARPNHTGVAPRCGGHRSALPSVISGVSCLVGFGYSPVAVLNVSSDDTIASDGSGASGWFRLRNVRGRARFTSAELFARKIAFCRMFVLNANSRRRHERRRQRSVRARQGTGR